VRLTEEGLSRNEAYELLGLSRAVGRRHLEQALATRRTSAEFSTASSTDRAPNAASADGESGASRLGVASEGRKC
jgi:hypothetical protein